jgi:hypothetical protein
MNPTRESEPARIVKRADVRIDAALALRSQSTADGVLAGESPLVPDVASAPRARHVTKEARLASGAPGAATLEVRCSCGEWTRVELATGGRGEGVER